VTRRNGHVTNKRELWLKPVAAPKGQEGYYRFSISGDNWSCPWVLFTELSPQYQFLSRIGIVVILENEPVAGAIHDFAANDPCARGILRLLPSLGSAIL